MAKEKDCRVLEVRTGSVQLLFSLWLIEKEEAYPEPPQDEKKPPKGTEEKEKKDNGKKDGGRKDPNLGANEPPMTDAQKRYLFRLLAEQGHDGERAHEELKKAFGRGVSP